MISQLANKHADKCRFCWMCRHLCPVQLKTGKEINTPRAKGLLLSMAARGKGYDESAAEAMYECFLCDACTNDCATGYQPPLFIREARTEAIVENLAPKTVKDLLERIEKTGNIYGMKKQPRKANGGEDILIYIGEVAGIAVGKMAEAFLGILDKAGISYQVLDEEPASGVMLGDLLGYVEEVRQQAKTCADAINAAGAKTLIVLDSYDAQIMIEKYPEWGCQIDADIVTATSYVAELLENGRLLVKEKQKGMAAYHDDDRLARTFHEFEPARKIAKAVGYELVEMFNHRELAKSCGTSLAKSYIPEIVKKTAQGRWEDLMRTEAEIMLTANPQAWECLAEVIPEERRLVDLFEAVYQAC